MKNWKTTVFGILAAVPTLLHVVGVQGIGHIGAVSIDQAAAAIGALFLGFYAKDKNVTGGTVQQ